MTQLPTISDLAGFAASPEAVPMGWMPLADVIPPLDMVVERFVESAGHCHALFQVAGPQPHALILNTRRGRMGEASFIFTDRDAAWSWADQLGPDSGGSESDVYVSNIWYEPKGCAPVFEVSVHEYQSETSPEAWVMLQCVCPLVSVGPKASA